MPETLWGRVSYNKQRDRWQVRGRWQGKQLYYSTYQTIIGHKSCKTQIEANQLQFLISAEMEQGIFNPLRYKPAKPHHIKRYSEIWMEAIKPPVVSLSTWRTYRSHMKHIVAGLGTVYIGDLSHGMIRNWLKELPLVMSTKRCCQDLLKHMLGDALKDGHITQLPQFVAFTGGFAVPKKVKVWIEEDDQVAVIKEINPEDRFIFQFLHATGVRPSEARALRKRDIDREHGRIFIRSTFSAGNILKEVKQKEERPIPFYAALDEFWDNIPVYIGSEFVFNNSRTGRHYTHHFNRIWNIACQKALGRVIKLNNCGRHSFANNLLAKGVPMDVVSSLLGHSNTKITTDNYANQNTNVLKTMVDNVRMV
jgi:hypothetical protein